jgi:hypothetical protein
MMNYLLESSICIVLFYGLYHLIFKDKPTHGQNRTYLLSSLMLALMIPILSIPIYKHESILSTATQLPIKGDMIVPLGVESEILSYDWSLIWPFIYIAGVLISLFIVLRGTYHIYTIIKNGEPIQHEGLTIIYTGADITLCSFGKYVIAPIDRKENLTTYELTHESNHIRKGHTLDVLFIKVFRAFFWFNPILVLYEKRLIEVHEYQADEATQTNLGKESYVSFLVDQVSRKRQPAIVHNFNSLIKKRLIMMSSESRSNKLRYLAILPVLLVGLSLFSFESYTVYMDTNGNELITKNDTIPSFPLLAAEKNNNISGAKIDTFSTYHSDLKKEVKYILVRPLLQNAYLIVDENPEINSIVRIDTITTIDYDTYKEETVVINYQTGVIDTLK